MNLLDCHLLVPLSAFSTQSLWTVINTTLSASVSLNCSAMYFCYGIYSRYLCFDTTLTNVQSFALLHPQILCVVCNFTNLEWSPHLYNSIFWCMWQIFTYINISPYKVNNPCIIYLSIFRTKRERNIKKMLFPISFYIFLTIYLT